MESKDLEQYIKRLKTGDKSAFEPIYDEMYKTVFFMCYSMVKHKESAEDLTQDTFVKMYQKILSYEEGTNFKAWLLQIAKNSTLNFIEKNKRETLIDINSEEYRNSEKDGVDPNADFDAIGIAKKVLTEEEFQIVTYIVINGLKRREVSKILDMPIGTVTWKYNVAMEKLRKAVK